MSLTEDSDSLRQAKYFTNRNYIFIEHIKDKSKKYFREKFSASFSKIKPKYFERSSEGNTVEAAYYDHFGTRAF